MDRMKDAKAKIERIQKDRITKLNDLEQQIRKTNELMNKAAADMSEAEKRSDAELYKLANAEKKDAEEVLQMYKSRKLALQTKPLVDAAEYQAIAGMIKSEVTNEEEKAIARMRKICQELETLAGHLVSVQKEANESLYILQNDIYRNQDRTRNANGVILNLSFETLHVDISPTINWIKTPLKAKTRKGV